MLVALRPFVVLNQLGPLLDPVLSDFGSRLHVISGDRDASDVWETGKADILLTGPSSAWKAAPATPPAGWGAGPRWIHTVSAGVDGFPQWALRGRIVTCGRGNAASPIAEYVLSALLLREKRLVELQPDTPEAWQCIGNEIKNGASLGTLENRALGIAGFGAVGQAIAARAQAFGMRIYAWRRSPWLDVPPAVEPVASLEELVRISDHLALALPLTDATRHCVNESLLAHANPNLHLINIARGDLIDQEALLAALDNGKLGFATLDVATPEPLPAGHRFYTHPRIRLTPHISWSGPQVAKHLAERVRVNLTRFCNGEKLIDVVDAERGY